MEPAHPTPARASTRSASAPCKQQEKNGESRLRAISLFVTGVCALPHKEFDRVKSTQLSLPEPASERIERLLADNELRPARRLVVSGRCCMCDADEAERLHSRLGPARSPEPSPSQGHPVTAQECTAMKHIAIVGSRTFTAPETSPSSERSISRWVEREGDAHHVVSGGGAGRDGIAETFAVESSTSRASSTSPNWRPEGVENHARVQAQRPHRSRCRRRHRLLRSPASLRGDRQHRRLRQVRRQARLRVPRRGLDVHQGVAMFDRFRSDHQSRSPLSRQAGRGLDARQRRVVHLHEGLLSASASAGSAGRWCLDAGASGRHSPGWPGLPRRAIAKPSSATATAPGPVGGASTFQARS